MGIPTVVAYVSSEPSSSFSVRHVQASCDVMVTKLPKGGCAHNREDGSGLSQRGFTATAYP